MSVSVGVGVLRHAPPQTEVHIPIEGEFHACTGCMIGFGRSDPLVLPNLAAQKLADIRRKVMRFHTVDWISFSTNAVEFGGADLSRNGAPTDEISFVCRVLEEFGYRPLRDSILVRS